MQLYRYLGGFVSFALIPFLLTAPGCGGGTTTSVDDTGTLPDGGGIDADTADGPDTRADVNDGDTEPIDTDLPDTAMPDTDPPDVPDTDGEGMLMLGSAMVDFGPVVVGADATVSVEMFNAGDQPVEVRDITTANAGPFVVLPPTQRTLAAGQRADLVVRFAPVQVGAVTDTLTLT
ncbi:MAG: hypothetical protein AAFX99_23990, partial [Myxococcota bacterium]